MANEKETKNEIQENSEKIRIGLQKLMIKALEKTEEDDFDFDKQWAKTMSLADKATKVLSLDAKLDEQEYGSGLHDDEDEDLEEE